MSGGFQFGIILGDQPLTVDARTHLDVVLRQVEAAQRNGFTYKYQRHGSSLDDFEAWASERAIYGSGEDCLAVPRERLDPARFSPLIVRSAWPGQSPEQVTDYLDELGREVIGPMNGGP